MTDGCIFLRIHDFAARLQAHRGAPGGNSGRPWPTRKMKLQVLGCAGGIGGRERLTTCLWLDHDILLDAGTGLATLDINQLSGINHVFLSHSHLDHVTGLALLVDVVMGKRTEPVVVHATEKVIATLKSHLFNWFLWPDFAKIPNEDAPILRWEPIQHGTTLEIDGRLITPYPVNHTVDATAYWVHNKKNGFLFTGDMSTTPALWAALCNEKKLRKVIVDCSFSNDEFDLAAMSKHFCPRSLIVDIVPMASSIEFLIYHLKPGQEDLIMEELNASDSKRTFNALKRGDSFVF